MGRWNNSQIIMKIRLFVFFFALATSVGMYAEIYSGTCGSEGDGLLLQWTLNTEDSTLTISGTGAMPNYSVYGSPAPWEGYKSLIKTVIIENGCTRIGEGAFSSCENLISAHIPASVTSINYTSFMSCNSLLSLDVAADNSTLSSDDGVLFDKDKRRIYKFPAGKQGAYIVPTSVQIIREYAFEQCRHLTSIELPDELSEIGERAFSFCVGLTSLYIPDDVGYIGSNAFSNVPNIEYHGTKSAVDKWGARCLNGYIDGFFVYSDISHINLAACSASASGHIDIPDGVENLGIYVFYACNNISTITIPNSVLAMEYGAFMLCTGLTEIELPSSITTISEDAFYRCESLATITIPSSVTSIGSNAFSECKNMTTVYNYATTPQAIVSNVFNRSSISTCTLYVPDKSLQLYQEAETWKKFQYILPLSLSPQSIDNQTISNQITSSQKIFCNGQIFILRGDKTYTLQGQEVK